MIEQHMPLARRLAHRYKRAREPMADLEQVAYVALVKAVDGYDPDRGAAFSSYAVPCIVGAIKRHFRDCGWAVHVPRAAKDLACEIERLTDAHWSTMGRAPSVAELAQLTDTSIEAILEAREASSARYAEGLETKSADDTEPNPSLQRLGGDDPALARALDRHVIDSALATLPARHRLVVILRFREDLSQPEIASRLGYSQAHISRLICEALDQLRSLFDQPGGIAA
jgi:RNA polymerase sigma-B factor